MASLDELYNTVLADEDEKAAFAEAAKTPEGLSAFLAERGCNATPEQVGEFLKAKMPDQGEMSDAELDSVAGGCNGTEAALSIVSLGVTCAYLATFSRGMDDMKGDDGQILCNVTFV